MLPGIGLSGTPGPPSCADCCSEDTAATSGTTSTSASGVGSASAAVAADSLREPPVPIFCSVGGAGVACRVCWSRCARGEGSPALELRRIGAGCSSASLRFRSATGRQKTTMSVAAFIFRDGAGKRRGVVDAPFVKLPKWQRMKNGSSTASTESARHVTLINCASTHPSRTLALR